MSLINQMLQDLEQRNASVGKTAPISGEVRAVPVAQSRWPVMSMGVALLVVLAGGATWVVLHETPKPNVSVAVGPSTAQTPKVVSKQPEASAVAITPTSFPERTSFETLPAKTLPGDAAAALSYAEVKRMQGLDRSLATIPAASPATIMPTEKSSRLATVPDSLASDSTAGQLVAEAVAKPMFAEPVPIKQKLAAKSAAGNTGASIKTVSQAQQSDNHYRQSLTLLQQGRVAEAQDMMRKALETNPRNLKARQALVGLLVEGRHHDEAMALLQEGVKLTPEQSGLCMALARLQVEVGDGKGASNTLEQGLQYAGEDAEYHAFYAALMQREDRHDEAVAHYLTALKSNPAMPSWLVGIGISWQAQGKLADAGEAYQRAKDTGQLTPQVSQFVEQRLIQVRQAR